MIIRFSVLSLSLCSFPVICLPSVISAHAHHTYPENKLSLSFEQTLTSVRTILVAKGPCAPTSQVAMNAPVHRGSRGMEPLEQVVLTSMSALLIPLDMIMWII